MSTDSCQIWCVEVFHHAAVRNMVMKMLKCKNKFWVQCRHFGTLLLTTQALNSNKSVSYLGFLPQGKVHYCLFPVSKLVSYNSFWMLFNTTCNVMQWGFVLRKMGMYMYLLIIEPVPVFILSIIMQYCACYCLCMTFFLDSWKIFHWLKGTFYQDVPQ